MTTIPRVSVITINRNSGADADRTIASVLAQDTPFEWVVVDGASTDGSVEALRAAVRPGDQFHSGPDQGIADAFNKGLALATGEAVLFMNAGDTFAGPDRLRRLAVSWERGRSKWIAASAEVVGDDGQPRYVRDLAARRQGSALVRQGCRIMHQAVLADRALFRELGGFDESYRIAMDYELWLRWIAAGHLPQTSSLVVARFRLGGISRNLQRRLAEERRARAAHGLANPPWVEWRLGAITALKSLLVGRLGTWSYRVKERLGW